MKNEVEIKLLFHPKDLSRLKNIPSIRKLTSGRPRTRRLVSTYYDTPGHKLRKQFITLRVRKESTRYIQCVKSRGDNIGGVLVREERENQLKSASPDVSSIPDKRLRQIVSRAGAGKLEATFKTDFKRTTRNIKFDDGTRASLDIDIGEIVTAKAREPICELEIELISGQTQRLLEMALDIHSHVPLRLSVNSKSRRGFVLLTGEKPAWRKDTRIDLSHDSTVEKAMMHTVQNCLNHLLYNEECTLKSEHPEGVHQMRVALRRLRSALVVFRPVIPTDQHRWIADEVKWLTSQTAATRDWDVFEDEIMGPVLEHSPNDKAFSVIQRRLTKERKSNRLATRRAIRSERYTRLLLRISAWMAERAWRDNKDKAAMGLLRGPLRDLSDSLLEKRHKKVRKQGRNFWRMSIEERHQLRIDVKKLRYATDFFSSMYPQKKVKPFTAKLAKLQDALGYLNDVSVAESLVQRLYAGCRGEDALLCRLAGGIVIGWHLQALVHSESLLAKGVADFIKCKPFWSKRS